MRQTLIGSNYLKMIAKISGRVEHTYEDSLIVTTHGVGYQILCTKAVLNSCVIGDAISLFISSQIKEQQYITYFGFTSEPEKATFLLLQSVSGVGTKMAMAMLSNFVPSELSCAITAQDKNLLTSIPGVGPKLADRIILELKNKINLLAVSAIHTNANQQSNAILTDAALALSALGINYTEALEKVRNIQKQLNGATLSLEDLIKLALQ